jgi:hypothetical protein
MPKLVFPCGHLSRCARGSLVVETQQMKDAMNQENGTFLSEPAARLERLPPGGLKGNGHIAQEPVPAGSAHILVLGKRDNIGRPVSFEVVAIKSPDSRIVKQQDAQLILLTAQVF